MMKILKEITADWNMDSDVFPNHTYLLNSKGQIVAFAKLGGDNITELKSRIYLDKRYRKFVEIKHAGLSKLIPKYNKEAKIFVYDHTVTKVFWLKHFINSFLHFIHNKKKQYD